MNRLLKQFAPLEKMIREMVRKQNSLTAFTLLELMIVVVIVAILASLSVPQYTKAVERTRDKEAIVNLQLIAAAERMYRLEHGQYFPNFAGWESNVDNINGGLRLDLRETNWDYQVIRAIGPPPGFRIQAFRLVAQEAPLQYERVYEIRDTTPEPTCSGVNAGSCP